jgi:hypothetical protein
MVPPLTSLLTWGTSTGPAHKGVYARGGFVSYASFKEAVDHSKLSDKHFAQTKARTYQYGVGLGSMNAA